MLYDNKILFSNLNTTNHESLHFVSFLIRLQSQGDMGTRKQEVYWFIKRHSNENGANPNGPFLCQRKKLYSCDWLRLFLDRFLIIFFYSLLRTQTRTIGFEFDLILFLILIEAIW